VSCEERVASTTTSTGVGDFDVREELIAKSQTTISSSLLGSAQCRDVPDIGLASAQGLTDQLTASRYEDFNNNDDDNQPHSDAFQTSFRLNEQLQSRTVPVVQSRHDVKFIDDDYDSELDGVDQKQFDRRTTTSVATADDDVTTSNTSADLGRRWGTVELIPKPSVISPLPSSDALPLKSIMKSPRPSSEKTLSKTRKGISFSQDTVFK